MYQPRTRNHKRDPHVRWALPERVFFACGACHVLAAAFLARWPDCGGKAIWIRPAAGFTGNHIVVSNGRWVFDYHGYSGSDAYFAHTWRKARRAWPGWDATLVELPAEALLSEAKSRRYDGLWLMQPGAFLHDAMPRARAYLERFPSPGGVEGLAGTSLPLGRFAPDS